MGKPPPKFTPRPPRPNASPSHPVCIKDLTLIEKLNRYPQFTPRDAFPVISYKAMGVVLQKIYSCIKNAYTDRVGLLSQVAISCHFKCGPPFNFKNLLYSFHVGCSFLVYGTRSNFFNFPRHRPSAYLLKSLEKITKY